MSLAPVEPRPDAPALGTVLVGPPVATWRDVAPVVGFYARHAEALPRPDPAGRVLFGVGQVWRAARLVAADPALRRAALLPTLLTLAGCGLLAALFSGEATDGDGNPLPTFQAYLATFVALSSMPPTLLQRMWVRVALEGRRALGMSAGEQAFAGVGYVRLIWRESVKALRQALVVSIGLAPLLGLVKALPFGRQEAAVVGATWAFYWIVVDAFELPIEVVPGPRRGGGPPWYTRGLGWVGARSRWLRPFGWLGRALGRLTRPWHEEVQVTERRRWETLGFGVAVGALVAIPVVGLFFRSVAMVGATGIVRLDEATGAPPPAGSGPPPPPPPP